MFLVVLLSLFALSEQCCQPAKFEGIYDVDIGSDSPKSLNQIHARHSYDSDRRMYNLVGSGNINGNAYTFRNIHDFNNNTMYAISGTTCTPTSPIPYPFFEKCLRDASKTGDGYIGKGANAKVVHFYEEFSPQGEGYKATFDDDCIIIDMVVFRGGHTMQVDRLSNVTIGIKDESVFDIPSFCHKA